MKNILLFISLFHFSFTISISQELLTIEDAVALGLKNNFDVLIARNQADISKINNTKGNAGMLPTIQLYGTGSYILNNNQKEFVEQNGANSLSSSNRIISAGAELFWTLYDGGKMFVSKNKLNEISNLGEIEFKEKVLQTIFDISEKYYDIVKKKQQLNSINEVINFNQQRVTIAQTGFNAGSLSKIDLLQAKIDLNVVKENAVTQEYLIYVSKKELYNLMGEFMDNDFDVYDSIDIDYMPDKNAMLEKLNTSNITLLSYQKQIEISKLKVQENRSAYYPNFDIRTGYYFSNSYYDQATIQKNTTFGPQIRATLSIPLYNAGETDRKTAESQMLLQSAEIDLKYLKLKLTAELQNALTDFENQKKLLEIETENNSLAKENLEVSIDRLRYGQTTSLEVHLAQESYVQSFTRLINFKYNLKIAETKLKQLTAEL